MPTIDDVARVAGVSKSTVSRVILGGNKVKPKTLEAVRRVIEELNYTPNTAARSLASKRTGNIAVISSYTFNDPFYSVVAEEIYNTMLGKGYNTLLFTYRSDTEGLKEPCDIFHGMVDAFIYMGDHSVTSEQLQKVQRRGLATALFKTGIQADGVISADVDNMQGVISGTEYLIRHGHRKIALVRGFEGYYETNERVEGYRRAIQANGIALDDRMIIDCNYGYNDALAKTSQILNSGATAVFCLSDMMAHGFIRGAKNTGVRVPEDISVLGFDDIMFKNFDSIIGLTTVHQPLVEMGRFLAEAVWTQIETSHCAGKRTFLTKIIPRETVLPRS